MSYQGHAFHTSLPNGRGAGTLRCTDQQLCFEADSSAISLPLEGLQCQLGGARNRLIFFSHPSHPDWALYTSDHALLQESALAGLPTVQALHQHRSRLRWHGLGWMLAAIAVLVLLPLGLYLSMDTVTAQVAARLPASWENTLGETAWDQYRIQHEQMEGGNGPAQLQALTEPLVVAAENPRHYKFRFVVINDPSLNAFALPGGQVVIHSGLILAAEHGNELQGVLGHELSHVTHQHGVRSVISSVGTFALVQALFGDVSGLAGLAVTAGPMLLSQSYSRDFEREADRSGLALLQKAHIDPQGMVTFFKRMQKEEQRQLAKVEDENQRELIKAGSRFLGTHPATEERIQNLQQQMPGMQDWRDMDPEFKALKIAVAEFVAAQEKTPNKAGNNSRSTDE